MPSYTLRRMFLGCIALFALYLVLMGMTLFFAASKNALSGELQVRENTVAALETEYYDAISKLGAADLLGAGFVHPLAVEYVSEGGDTAVTRADR